MMGGSDGAVLEEEEGLFGSCWGEGQGEGVAGEGLS